jgi:PAS domain S-box-containing protein
MNPELRAIIVEDNPDDARLVERELERAGYAVHSRRVETAEQLSQALTDCQWDIVLADYSLPHFSAPEALAILQKRGCDIPCIVVSGSIGEETAVALMRSGADDYIMKGALARLGPAVHRELREAEERRNKRTAEQALTASERRYRLLLENMSDEVWYTDASGHITLANPAAAQVGPTDSIQETSTEELYRLLDVTHVDGTPRSREEWPAIRALQGEVVRGVEERLRLPGSGELRYRLVNATPIRDASGIVTGSVTVVRDITQLKLADRALQESEERYRSMVNNLPGFVYRCRNDPDWTMLFMSDGCRAVTGYTPEDLVENKAVSYGDLIRPDYRAFVWQSVQEALAHETSYEYEYPIAVQSGEPDHWVWERGRGVFSEEEDELLYLEGFVTDVTDLHRARAEKDALQAELQQSAKMEAVGQLAGGIAHDFNNLVTGILGNVDLLRQELSPSGTTAVQLAAIERAARQAASLAKGLLTFGRRAPVAPVALDMVEAVNNGLAILEESLPASIRIERDIDANIWPVLADPSQITQIILNLGVNARDAMDGSGTIVVRLHDEQMTEKYVREHTFARLGQFVHLAIADTGPGIPDEIRGHLFEPFFTTKKPGSGTGLGLSIVYGAIKQAGGWITVDSQPGKGATFDIFLPATSEPPATSKPATPWPVPVTGATVLLVEDEPQVAAVTEALLKRRGCQTLRASDGAGALDVLRANARMVDLVLLDMTMPGMTTDEIVAAIRDIDGQLPIVLTSGYTSGDAVSRMVETGLVQAFLPKPYQSEELLDVVGRFARPRRQDKS